MTIDRGASGGVIGGPIRRPAAPGRPGQDAEPPARPRWVPWGGAPRARARGLSPAGLVILAATAVAGVSRAFVLTRHGFATSGTVEYDDGVYLGASVRLLQGALPYRDYAFVQPPGILLVALPEALVATLTSTAKGLALARILTVCAGTACVPLAGRLVRHRGALVTLVTCGFLAVYPGDVMASRTLLLEPWMNLCCLLAANAAFRRGRLASPRRLAWAGVAFGFAATVKFWAGLPAAALFVTCLLAGQQRAARATRYGAGLAAGFILPTAALAGWAPAAFVRSTVLEQATRTAVYTPMSLRLDHLTGLIDLLAGQGFGVTPHAYTLFAATATASMEATTVGIAPALAVAIAVAALVAAGYLRRPGQRSPLEWFALAVTAGACAAIGGYSAFFYHYPAFPAPWLAITLGGAAGVLAGRAPRLRKALACGTAAAFLTAGTLQVTQLTAARAAGSPPIARAVPPGACVLTDQVSLAIAADRFTAARPGCPDVIDALAETLWLSGGVSPAGGAARMPGVVGAWRAILGRAQYVWLSGGSPNRIPWTPQLTAWFRSRFRLVARYPQYADSRLYARDR